MIILVGSNKGGAGKTTTAINILSGLEKKGFEVLGIDGDNQKSFSKWGHDREDNRSLTALTIMEKTGNISQTLRSMRDKYDFIVVDVAGRNSIELISSMVEVDFIVSPVQCSQLDLDTMTELKEQYDRAKPLNNNLKVYIYNVMLNTNHNVYKSDRLIFEDWVKDYEEFKLLNSFNCYRKVYRDVISEGKSVFEQDKDNKSKVESQKLINEILEYCNK